jgi:hypothetical protein
MARSITIILSLCSAACAAAVSISSSPTAARHTALNSAPAGVYALATNGSLSWLDPVSGNSSVLNPGFKKAEALPDVSAIDTAAAIFYFMLSTEGRNPPVLSAAPTLPRGDHDNHGPASQSVRDTVMPAHQARRAAALAAAAGTGGLWLVGLELASGAVVVTRDVLNITNFFVPVAMQYDAPSGSLLLLGSTPENRTFVQALLLAPQAAGNGLVLGTVPLCTDEGSDSTWDPVARVLYVLQSNGNDDDNNGFVCALNVSSMTTTSFQPGADYVLPQWDPVSRSLVGLSLSRPQPGVFLRDLALLPPGGGNFTSHGSLGALSVLYEGPKAADMAGRRAFYVIATSPVAPLVLAGVDIDAVPAVVVSQVPICGVIFDCPMVIGYYNASGQVAA